MVGSGSSLESWALGSAASAWRRRVATCLRLKISTLSQRLLTVFVRYRERVRPIQSAVILAVGSELTTGHDARHQLRRSGARADRAGRARAALDGAAGRPGRCHRRPFGARSSDADLVVSTGGLGPTPDDLTREAIAAACGLEPRVDAALLARIEACSRGAAQPCPRRTASRRGSSMAPWPCTTPMGLRPAGGSIGQTAAS